MFYLNLSLIVTLSLLSAFHFSLRYNEQGPNDIRTIVKSTTIYEIFAQVTDWPAIKHDRTELRLEVDSLRYDVDGYRITRRLTGGLLLKVSDTTAILQRGDRIQFRSRIYLFQERETSFGEFDYAEYLNLKGVYGTLFLPTLHSVKVDRRLTSGYFQLVDKVRLILLDSFRRNLSPLSAALAGGFLIGETREIPPSVYESFRDSGTLHLLAVSGSNVALVILFALFIMRPISMGKVTRSVLLIGVLIIFAGISYGDPSVMRASIMAFLIIIARLLARTYDLNNIIALTALIILLAEPSQFYDVGFQLSFITAWGLIFIMPKLILIFERVKDRRWYRWFLFPLLISAVAQICSTPIIAYYFDRLPLLSLPANLLIVPAVSIGVLGLLVMLVADFIFPLFGFWLGSLVDLWMRFIIELLDIFGGENVALLDTGNLFDGLSGIFLVLTIYLMIFLGVLAITLKQARRGLILFILLSFNTLLIHTIISGENEDGVQIEYRSIPGGISMMIWFEDSGSCDLVITSISGRDYRIDERIIAPYLIEKDIDSIRNLFLLSADYRSLDDISRLAERFNTSKFYIQPNIEKSLVDVMLQGQELQYSGEIIPLKELQEEKLKRGFSYYDNYLVLLTDINRIDILTDYSSLLLHIASQEDKNQTSLNKTIVAGSGKALSTAEWAKLLSLGYFEVICSKVKQKSGDSQIDIRLETHNHPPPSVIELSKVSSYRQSLTIISKVP